MEDEDEDFVGVRARGGDDGAAPRRSSRKRKTADFNKYFDDDGDDADLVDSEEERESKRLLEEEAEENKKPQIDKLLGMRNAPQGGVEMLVKYRDQSYLHVRWIHEDDLKATYRRQVNRINKFKGRVLQGKVSFVNSDGEEEFFDPTFTDVDRILAEETQVEEQAMEEIDADLRWFHWLGGKLASKGGVGSVRLGGSGDASARTKKVVRRMFLVKWRNLSYKEATWEYEEDVQNDFSVALFHRVNRVPTSINSTKNRDAEEDSLWPALAQPAQPLMGKGSAAAASAASAATAAKEEEEEEATATNHSAAGTTGAAGATPAPAQVKLSKTARLPPVAARTLSGTKARSAVVIPPFLDGFALQGEICGVLPGDEIIAVQELSVQGEDLSSVTSHITARARELSSRKIDSLMLTVRRFVKRMDKPGDPIETVLYNVRFGLGPLGILLKTLGEGMFRVVPRPRAAMSQPVYVDDLLRPNSPQYAKSAADHGEPCANQSLRLLFLGFFSNMHWHCWAPKGHNHERGNVGKLADMICIDKELLVKWLMSWRVVRDANGRMDMGELAVVESGLWDWLFRSRHVLSFATYGRVSQERLERLLKGGLNGVATARRVQNLLRALEVFRIHDEEKRRAFTSASSKRRNQRRTEDAHGINDNFRMHNLVKVAPVLDSIISKIEDEHMTSTSSGEAKSGAEAEAEAEAAEKAVFEALRSEPEDVRFDGGPRDPPEPEHETVSRWMSQACRAVSWVFLLRQGMPIDAAEALEFQSYVSSLKKRADQMQAARMWEEGQRRKAWCKLVSEMPAAEAPFLGDVPLTLQRDLQRKEQEKRLQGKRGSMNEVSTAHGTLLGHKMRRRLLTRLRSTRFVPYTQRNQPRYKHGNMLRSYQLNGINWILEHWYQGVSCILADEMGLGKTVQVVATLEHLRTKESLRGPFLIIAPLSTIGHWHREIETWTDMNLCKYYDTGGAEAREVIRTYEWYYPSLAGRMDLLKFHVMVTTYETFMADVEHLAALPWLGVVIDEGHRLRSSKSKLLEMVNRISDAHRLLLTGTPLQNNIAELWSLLNYCSPDTFPDLDYFLEKYGDMQSKAQLDELQAEIAPFMLRRVKEDVEKSIPPKEETIIDVELTMLQKRYYRAIFDRNRQVLYRGCKSGNKPQLINVEMELRKCCNHPYLISGVQENEEGKLHKDLKRKLRNVDDLVKQVEAKANGIKPEAGARKGGADGSGSESGSEPNAADKDDDKDDDEVEALDRLVVNCHKKGLDRGATRAQAELEQAVRISGKMVLVDKLLPKLRAEGHKVLIFSQFVRVLDMLQYLCHGRNYPFERIDGNVHGNRRQAAIDRFSNPNSGSFVFLLSTRAGGVGINLTAADTVIIFDSDWNPQNDAQAQARVHRIGQKKAVKIFRLVTKNTYEETMLQRAALKLGLERAVLGSVHESSSKAGAGGDQNKGVSGRDLSSKELEKMLREGAYHHLQEDDGSAAKTFVGADIDDLLKTNARTVVFKKMPGEAEPGSGALDKLKHNTVNKSSFKSEREDGVDVNDPEFWAKVLPDMVTPDNLLAKLNDQGEAALLASSSDKRRAFMDDVRALVRDIVAQRNGGELVNEHDMETSQALLVQISNMRTTFGSDSFSAANRLKKPYTDLAHRWLNRLESLRERRARRSGAGAAKGDESDDELFSGAESDGEEAPVASPLAARATAGSEGDAPLNNGRSKYAEWDDDDPDLLMSDQEAGAGTEPVPYTLLPDHMTEVCALCADGGELIVCEGPCKRAFHMKCLDEASRNKADTQEEWLCPDCESGYHNCLLCGETGFAGVESGVYECSEPTCGRFHHVRCIKQSAKGQVLDAAKGIILCPLHRCEVCAVDTEERPVTVHCIRCFRGFHAECLDPTRTMRLHQNLVICAEHLDGKKFPAESHFPFDPNAKLRLQNNVRQSRRASARRRSRRAPDENEAPPRQPPADTKAKRRPAPAGPDRTDIDWRKTDGVDPSAVVIQTCALCTQDGKVPPASSAATPAPADETPMVPYPFLQPKGKSFSRVWVHTLCAALSPEVFVDELNQFHNVLKAVRRGRFLNCEDCNQRGATLGCFMSKCNKSFHVPCAVAAGWDPNVEAEFLCEAHRPKRKGVTRSSRKSRAVLPPPKTPANGARKRKRASRGSAFVEPDTEYGADEAGDGEEDGDDDDDEDAEEWDGGRRGSSRRGSRRAPRRSGKRAAPATPATPEEGPVEPAFVKKARIDDTTIAVSVRCGAVQASDFLTPQG